MLEKTSRQLVESIYPLVSCTVFLLTGLWILAITPFCTAGLPWLPTASSADFVVTRERISEVWVPRTGTTYLGGVELADGALSEALRLANTSLGPSRVTVLGDRRVTFGRIKQAIRAAQNAGYQEVTLLTEKPTSPLFVLP
jgi:biopolymer transport protein ExbD